MKKILGLSFALGILLSSCAEMQKKDMERLQKMEKMGDITMEDGAGITQTEYEKVRPFLRSADLAGKKVHVVYKAGELRKVILQTVRDDLALQPKDFKKLFEQEKFNAKYFQEYIIWIPKETKLNQLQIFQNVAGKKVKPFYVEPFAGSEATLQHLFPFADPNHSIPLLIRFKRQGRVIPGLLVQLEKGKETKFQWVRPKASKVQRNSPK